MSSPLPPLVIISILASWIPFSSVSWPKSRLNCTFGVVEAKFKEDFAGFLARFAGFRTLTDGYFNLELFVFIAFGRYYYLVELDLSLPILLLFALVLTNNLIAEHDQMLLMSNLSLVWSNSLRVILSREVNQPVYFFRILDHVDGNNSLLHQSTLCLIHFSKIIKES